MLALPSWCCEREMPPTAREPCPSTHGPPLQVLGLALGPLDLVTEETLPRSMFKAKTHSATSAGRQDVTPPRSSRLTASSTPLAHPAPRLRFQPEPRPRPDCSTSPRCFQMEQLLAGELFDAHADSGLVFPALPPVVALEEQSRVLVLRPHRG